MGLHLSAGALNQAALARGQAARAAALCWLLAAAVFVGWMVSGRSAHLGIGVRQRYECVRRGIEA